MQAFHSSIVRLCWTLQVEGIAQVALGSSVVEANELGQVISDEEYYPYGSSAYQVSSSSADLSLKRYRFTGKERDEEMGLDYFGVRYYASWLGRWTSGDSGGFVDGLNLYRYVRNNPVNGVDAMGYMTEPPPGYEEALQNAMDLYGSDGYDIEATVSYIKGEYNNKCHFCRW